MGHVELLERLAHSGVLEDCQMLSPEQAHEWMKGRSVEVALSGWMRIHGHRLLLRVGLPRSFPLCLPEVAVERVDPPLELPHVSSDGKLCFEPEGNLLLDRREPWSVLWESLQRVREMLHALLAGNLAEEFAQEAVAYWRGLARGPGIRCIVTAGDHPHPTTALFFKGKLYAVADEPRVYFQSLSQRSASELTHRNAVYIPIDPVAADPAFQPKKLLTFESLRAYVQALPEGERQVLSGLLARLHKREEFVVLGVRRPDGERALLGVNLFSNDGIHPLAHAQATGKVEPVSLARLDREFLAPRGGASIGLHERGVLIAGCGAVGGYLALSLARAGVGRISLVDSDSFELANTYRHVCGMAWEGRPKVDGLKREIERLVPFVTVTPYKSSVEDLLAERPEVFREQDLVLSALGNPTVELHLNEWIWSSDGHPPALFTWLEPLGLGGHALLTHVHGVERLERGCFECLHERTTSGGGLENQAAFAEPGKQYTRDMLGCGNRHMPFADLDAQRTATLAGSLALRVLHREIQGAPLMSWRGEKQAFEREGYSVTPRYSMEPGPSGEERPSYVRPDCPVCQE